MKNITILLFLIFNLQIAQAQDKFEKLWNKVEQLEQQGKYKSASEIVNKILKKANRSKKSDQIVKSLIYKSKFSLLLEEDAQEQIVLEIESYIKESEFPTNNILESVYAEFLQQYFKKNRYRISGRTKLNNNEFVSDFKNWDATTFIEQIANHYNQSLQRENELKELPIKKYKAILTQSKTSEKFRPTLYDFLAHRSINFFKVDRWYLPQTTEKFQINNEKVFSASNEFVKEKFYTADSLFSNRNVLILFQKLELFHQNKDTVAYIDVLLQRLKLSLDKATIKNKKELYRNELNRLANKFENHEVSSQISFQLANFYFNESNVFNAKNDSILKNARIKSRLICKKTIKKYPFSDGGLLCKVLKNKIEEEVLSITTEEHIIPNKPFLAKVDFKSIDSLYISIYQIPYHYFNYNKQKKDSLALHTIKTKGKVFTKLYQLQSVKNYYNYTTEIIVPKLPIGNYLIVASKHKNFNVLKEIYGYNIVASTNLTMLSVNRDSDIVLRVLDRENGNPIKNVEIFIDSDKLKNKKGKTNNLGEYYIKKTKEYSNYINITASHQKDTLIQENFYINGKNDYEEEEEHNAKMTLFLDRSIYRPGQTIYFKGLLFEKKKGKTKVVSNVYTYVAIYDANGDEIKEYRLKTNKYGSISGEFKLPSNILTGEFSIEMDEDYGDDNDDEDPYWEQLDDIEYTEIYFSVEEYKRPQFEVVFNDITKNYKLGDTITVSGNVKAFFGATISEASVAFSVERSNVNFRYYSEKSIIKTGKTITDKLGEFQIKFIANPDSLLSKKEKPIFSYTIKADVTDINGETQSKEKNVFIGYQNLKVNVIMENKLLSNQEQSILINTQNLNGKEIPANVNLKIYKLEEPKRYLREKPWNPVEIQTIPKSKYIALFPHEEYDSLDLQKNWVIKEKVFSKKFDTSILQEVLLDKINQWETGFYVLKIEAVDKLNDTVTYKKRFEVTSPNKPNISNRKLFNSELLNTSYKKDKQITIRLNTPIKNLNVMVEASYKGKEVLRKNILIENNTTIIQIPVENYYTNKVEIILSSVKFNDFYIDQFSVNFPISEKELVVETISFRNKLTPDQKETWSFKITDPTGESAEAEVLASMYDASLDEFKEHYWEKEFRFEDDYSYRYDSDINAYTSFSTTSLKSFIQPRPNISGVLKNYHQLRWFGFDFGNSTYKNRSYINHLSLNKTNKPHIKGTISGIITDNSGVSLPGVNVLVAGTDIGTQTDFDGYYSINAPIGSEIVLSYVGFVTAGITVSKLSTINWVMEEDAAVLDEVVVTGYGGITEKKALGYAVSNVNSEEIVRSLSGAIAGVTITRTGGASGSGTNFIIRSKSSLNGSSNPLFIVDGVPWNINGSQLNINSTDIESVNFLKGKEAIALYGQQGRNGVVLITTKKALEALTKVEARDNLKETAFFYPHLTTNKKGEVSFSFNSPQALTKWKFMLLAHNKSLDIGTINKTAFTQKEINVIPNTPRFLREKDTIIISTKISNLTSKKQTGLSQLMLFDAFTMKPIDKELMNIEKTKNFAISPKGNTSVSWKLVIPEGLQAVVYKIVAKSGSHSDGESNVLPVLSSKILITEARPLWVPAGKTKKVVFEKLKNNASSTLKNHRFTLEYTSNPTWLAIQSLPYLMEFPHECAEQTFARYYANALANTIINKDSKIKEVFDSWKENKSLDSPLDKNENLKSALISESPWVKDGLTEKENKYRLAKLFDKERVNNQQLQAINKLNELQLSSGGFPWFSGGNENIFITQHILSGIGHLKKLKIESEYDYKFKNLIKKAITYIDTQFIKNYNYAVRKATDSTDIALNANTIQYLYTRSFYLKSHPITLTQDSIINNYLQKCKTSWLAQPLYSKAMIALVLNRMEEKKAAEKIIEALKEQAVHSEENGIYWKENTSSWNWYQSPIETQSILIEAFTEIKNNPKDIDQLKVWLLQNKRTNKWATTKATTEAIYALLMTGNDWLSVSENTIIKIGDETIKTKKLDEIKKEASTGYMKISWNENEINSNMASIKVTNKSDVTGYGGVYWQYFEELDAITSSTKNIPLQIKKDVFLKKITDKGEELILVTKNSQLKLGDLITVRLEITSNYDMEFIHLKDLRASGLEPTDVISEYKWQDGLGYYQSTKDVATHFFFDKIPKGQYIFEYDLRANNRGEFSNGITTIQSMYAPEFTDYSKAIRIKIDK